MVFGGIDKRSLTNRSIKFSTTQLSDFSSSEFKNLTKYEQLLMDDTFPQPAITFPLSSSFLTPDFVEEHVECFVTKAYLKDLRRYPASQLVAAVGMRAIHIFDKTHGLWVYADNTNGLMTYH